MNIALVVAKYKEDIRWIDETCCFNNIYIYDKSNEKETKISPSSLSKIHVNKKIQQKEKINLDNVGREAHTYLYHIINNFSNLDDYTLFCQGNPMYHDHKFLNKCNDIELTIKSIAEDNYEFYGPKVLEGIYGNFSEQHSAGLPMQYFFDLLFNKKLKKNDMIEVYYSAQFLLPKKLILSRPKSFYEFLFNFVKNEENPIEAYIFERLWSYIFNPNLKISDKYLSFQNSV